MSKFDWNGFNADDVDTPSREALPAGTYNVVITESAMEANRAGTGEFLKLDMTVLDGEHEGRHVWTRLNLDNPSEKAVQIARADLASICKAVGVITPKDSSDLHGKPLSIRVTIKKGDNGPMNNVKSFGPATTAAAPAAQTKAASAPASTPPAAGSTAEPRRPWSKK